jgi:predicted metal-binding protein
MEYWSSRFMTKAAANRATVQVCVTCRSNEAAKDSRPAGVDLFQATTTASQPATDVRVVPVRCLGNCNRSMSAAISTDSSWTYVYGDLDPTKDGPALVEGARLLGQTTDGLMPWKGRPEVLKRGLIARVPPKLVVDFETPEL